MPTIHFIDGEKGGVGKSFVARAMIQYALDRNQTFIAVEADRMNPDVANVYKDVCKHAIFTENEKEIGRADRIFELATRKPVIVSLRASYKTLLGEILAANVEIEEKIHDATNELIQIQSEIKADRETNIKLMKALIEGVGKTNSDLFELNSQIQKSISSWKKTRFQGIKKWIIPSVAILSGFSIILIGVIGLNFLETPKSEQSSSKRSQYLSYE